MIKLKTRNLDWIGLPWWTFDLLFLLFLHGLFVLVNQIIEIDLKTECLYKWSCKMILTIRLARKLIWAIDLDNWSRPKILTFVFNFWSRQSILEVGLANWSCLEGSDKSIDLVEDIILLLEDDLLLVQVGGLLQLSGHKLLNQTGMLALGINRSINQSINLI